MACLQTFGSTFRALALLGLAGAFSQTGKAQTKDMKAAAWRGMLDQYCVTCHGQRLKTAGPELDRVDLSHISTRAELWEKVIRKLRAGTMPPMGAPRPDRLVVNEFAGWLEHALDESAIGDPGPAALRRLNRTEYKTAVRDLLALDVDVTSWLPADDADHGFDNMADALKLSPALLEGYLSAARKISRLAVGDPDVTPAFDTFRVRADLGQDQHIEGLPLGTRGGILVRHNFPLDAEYIFKPKLAVDTSAKVRGLDFEHQVVVTVDGRVVHRALVGGSADEEAAAVSPPASEADIQSRLQTRVRVTAGPHVVGVSFGEKTSALPDGLLQPLHSY